MGKDIVKYRYIILIFFIVAIIVSCIFLPDMISKVNYDLTYYLPEGYDTHDGYTFLSENFNVHGDVEAGVYGTYESVENAVSQISELDGVTGANWANMFDLMLDTGIYEEDSDEFRELWSILTDSPTVNSPEFNPEEKYNWALLITLEYAPSELKAIDCFQQIKTILGTTVGNDSYSLSGMTEQANALFETVFDEIWLYCLIAGIVVLFILAVTTNSLMEPIILILTMVISIFINLGTNAIFPQTSIITFACTAILQLGLSMDYAIFLLHQYRYELKSTLDHKEALAKAIPKSAKAVFASALTTIGGFLALLCMKFGIGSDLGISLAKGIVCSLLTVIFLQPCLMLMMDKPMIKTQHKCLDLQFKTGIKKSIKHRWPIAIVFVLLLVPMYFASNSLHYNYVKFMPPSEDTSDKAIMAQELGNQVMIMLPYKDPETNTPLIEQNYAFISKINEMKERGDVSFSLGVFAMVPGDKQLTREALENMIPDDAPGNIKDMLDMLFGDSDSIEFRTLMELFAVAGDALGEIDLGMLTTYLSPGGYTMCTVGINPDIDLESQKGFDILDELRLYASQIFDNTGSYDPTTGEPIYQTEYHGKIYMTGITQAAYDFAKITPTDFMWVTIVSVLAIFVILLFTLGGVKFPILLVALIEFGIWVNVALQHVFAGGGVNFMSYLIISAVQLGATVDYAILITTKFRDLRKRFEPRQAAYEAVRTSVMTVLTSALIMAGACLSVYFVATNLIIKEMTFLMARGSLIAAILVIFVLPALLVAADKPSGNEIHIPRTPKLRRYKRATKKIRESWKTRNFGEIPVKPQRISGDEVYTLMHNGEDVSNMSDSDMRNKLDSENIENREIT